jgi:hypothetical protein
MSTMVAGHWLSVTKSDPRLVAMYAAHYSAAKNSATKDSWLRSGITGPCESMALLTEQCDAAFVWTLERVRHDGQDGVNCAVFRNTGAALSSDLIREADDLAWQRWPNEFRHFTYVDGSKVRSSNPGCCFLKAGWRRCGVSKGGLLILEIAR